jgi:hypothetical protein
MTKIQNPNPEDPGCEFDSDLTSALQRFGHWIFEFEICL